MSEIRPYHHGDLRDALIAAGLDLTRAGGPAALTVRAATRRAGVSPNAAYRHFADRAALLQAVRFAIQQRMAAGMGTMDQEADTTETGIAMLRAVGLGYIRFALTEPGWFSVAFFGEGDAQRAFGDTAWPAPFVALETALDALVTTASLAPADREGAEWPCFAAVHGFAELALRGPLRGKDTDSLMTLAERTVDTTIAGLLGR